MLTQAITVDCIYYVNTPVTLAPRLVKLSEQK